MSVDVLVRERCARGRIARPYPLVVRAGEIEIAGIEGAARDQERVLALEPLVVERALGPVGKRAIFGELAVPVEPYRVQAPERPACTPPLLEPRAGRGEFVQWGSCHERLHELFPVHMHCAGSLDAMGLAQPRGGDSAVELGSVARPFEDIDSV
jgi:hypothetical protein